MDLMSANKIINLIEKFVSLVNNNIGVITAEKRFYPDNEIWISIRCKNPEENKVGYFLLDYLCNYLKKYDNYSIGRYEQSFVGKVEQEGFTLSYKLNNKNPYESLKILFSILISALYYAVDEAKVEFCFHIEEDKEHIIPNEIYWELDVWNDGWIEDGEEENCVPEENLQTYKFKKDWLYSICLGYYGIDLTLFETDIVPELIGIVFDSTEEFCYVTSYEDKDWVYIYSVVSLNEDNIFDIEEGLFNLLGLISISKDTEGDTLEDYFSEVEKNDN